MTVICRLGSFLLCTIAFAAMECAMAAENCPMPPETPDETLALARRTYEYVAKSVPAEKLSVLKKELDADARWLAETKDEKWRRVIEKDIRRIRRRILFMHPDLQFDDLLAVQRGIRYVTELCMADQYVGRWSRPGPGLVALENWKKAPRKRVLLEGRLPKGAVLNPDLHWDAGKVIFAFADHTRKPEADPDRVKVPIVENMLGRHPNSEWVLSQDPGNPAFTEVDGVSQERKAAHVRYFIYEAAVDGSWVRQLTGGPGDEMKTTEDRQTVLVEDADPCYLPDGGFAFISTRNQNFGRCHWGRYTPSFLLYRADEGGRNIRPLSFGEANEWRPAVMNDGRIAYTRWDYINRHAVKFQSLWATRPDGTAVSHVYGNYSDFMYTTTEARAIPGSPLVLATASAHHNYTCGSLVLIDPRIGEDGPAPVACVTPEIPFPEACAGSAFGAGAWDVPGVFVNPTPVNDTLFFVSYSDEPLSFPKDHPRTRKTYGGAWPSQAAYGVWLVDRLGGRELIYKEDEWSTFNPIPLAKRARPPVLKSVLPPQDSAPTTGVCYVENVYDSRADLPEGSVKSLRINRLIDFYACRRPTFVQNLDLALYKECLGEVPVDGNGSAMFTIPAGVPIQLQAVDADGKAILTMRSFIYSQKGEIQGCIGCHEQKSMSAPSVRNPGVRRPDTPVKRVDLGYSGAFSFFRSIQPILEKKCVTCHDGGERRGKTVCDFRGTNGWHRLVKGGHVKFVKSYSETTESKPYDYFAAASPLMKRLDSGHGGVRLTDDERNTFILWMDLNVPDCWLGGGYSWHSPESRMCGPSRKPLPPGGRDMQGTCGMDDDCECNSCWVRRGGYNTSMKQGAPAAAFTVKGPVVPKPWETTAVKELADYLARRTGPFRVSVGDCSNVVFHVGDTAFAAKKGLASSTIEDERWVIRSFGGDVVLNGGGERGCLYAVCHFLEDWCGVRWWSETEEDVPEPGDLALPPLDATGKPAFLYRDIFRTTDPDKSRSLLAVRRRLNRNGDVPIPMSLGGAMTYGPPRHCHTFNAYMPWEKLGKTRPELFSIHDGKRCGGQDYKTGGQLCLTNPDVRKIILEGLVANIESSAAAAKREGCPAPRLFEVSMNDNRRFCQCTDCAAETEKYGHSGFYLNFINSLAAEVAKTHPEVYISTLAYYYTEEPPKGGVKAAPNVLVKLCNTRANMADTILAPGDNAIMRDLLEAWRGNAEHLFVWDYDITYTKDSRGYPFPSEWHYADKFRFYASHRVHGIFWEQESPDTSDLFDLKFYLKTKLFEDPDIDYADLLKRTFREYYGLKAGPLVYAARERLRDAQRRNKGNLHWFPQLNQFNFIRSEDIAAMRELYDKAEKAVADDARHLRRIRKTRAGLDRLAKRREGTFARGSFEGRPCWNFNPEKYALYGKEKTVLVDDAAAPTGKAVELAREKGYDSPLLVAYYDSRTKKQPFSTRMKVEDGETAYVWRDLGTATLAENGYFFMTKGWVVQLHIPSPDFAGKTFEVKVCACKTPEGRIRIGRMALVDAKAEKGK